ncbi:hypothetical protein ZWY2020_053104 [Hordeum vulgare]|nr:hypothetical protein ZWY2020_053104 [Hordeum vulgare]
MGGSSNTPTPTASVKVPAPLPLFLRSSPPRARAEEEGTKFTAVDLQPFINFFRRNNLQTEFFSIGPNQYLVTSIHEHWFCARCVNTTQPGGEGVIVMQIGAYLLVSMYKSVIKFPLKHALVHILAFHQHQA